MPVKNKLNLFNVKKVLLLDSTFLRKAAIVVFFSIMLLSLSSCVSILNTLLGNSTCIEPGCDRDTRGNSSYCIIHSDREPVEVDVSNPYRLHKTMSDEEMKARVKINRKN